METRTLKVEVRDTRGKGPARQLRMTGKIPGIFYGPGVETTTLALSPKELAQALSTEFGQNTLLDLDIDGRHELAMVKDLQMHPLTQAMVHVDLYKVSKDREIHVWVPLRPEGRPKGMAEGGRLTLVFRKLPVMAAPENIPAEISVDVTELEKGMHIRTDGLPLPAGVRVLLAPDRRVIVVSEEKRVIEEEVAADEAVPVEGAEGAVEGAVPAPEEGTGSSAS